MKFVVLVFVFTMLAVGCTTSEKTQRPLGVREISIDVRSDTHIIDPITGEHLDWSAVLDRIKDVEIILLGEQHDHVVGHAVQLAIVEDVFDRYPKSVLALEMLERDEQLLVDDYMEDIINAKKLAALTQSTNWGGDGGWEAWYQPIIDAVKDRGGSVVAANAPRRYVKFGRTSTVGYDRVDELPDDRRIFVDYPKELSSGRYRQRFWDLFAHGEEESDQEPVDVMTEVDPDDPKLATFKSQQIWDATMAQSIANTDPTLDRKTILLAGQFHVEYDGGIVQELRQRLPKARVLVISIHREAPDNEWEGAPVIADILIMGDIEVEYVDVEDSQE